MKKIYGLSYTGLYACIIYACMALIATLLSRILPDSAVSGIILWILTPFGLIVIIWAFYEIFHDIAYIRKGRYRFDLLTPDILKECGFVAGKNGNGQKFYELKDGTMLLASIEEYEGGALRTIVAGRYIELENVYQLQELFNLMGVIKMNKVLDEVMMKQSKS